MPDFDVFNGDADGICALHQLRLAMPRDAELVTGVKRDIALLQRVAAQAGDRVTVLDVSMKTNHDALLRILDAGASVAYFDHHQTNGIPAHPHLEAHIDTAATVCTSLLVNRYLEGRYLSWAVTAAFGDNLAEVAREAATPLGLPAPRLAILQRLGECLNYNGYGEHTDDLFFHPADLYRTLHAYHDPFEFVERASEYQILSQGYTADMERANALQPMLVNEAGALYVLPDAAWARRVSGVFGNALASTYPQRAHAVLTEKAGGYLVSVRAPLTSKSGADVLCSQFETGGGRKGAAGINFLPTGELERFIGAFHHIFATSLH